MFAASRLPVGLTISLRRSAGEEALGLMAASAVFEFTFDSDVSRAVSEALKPELLRSSERFVKSEVEAVGETLVLRLSAMDMVDLRAGVNSYLNLVKASSETLSTQL